jgi:hypothetical protein
MKTHQPARQPDNHSGGYRMVRSGEKAWVGTYLISNTGMDMKYYVHGIASIFI